jgi:hypothetical protein
MNAGASAMVNANPAMPRRMSALGHKRTFPDVQRMSALTLQADMRRRTHAGIWPSVYESTPFCNGPDEVKSPE